MDRRTFLKQSAITATAVSAIGINTEAQAELRPAHTFTGRAKETNTAKTAELPRTPEDFFSIMEKRFNSLDVQQALALFHPDAIFVDGSAKIHKGLAAIEKELTGYFATGLQMKMMHRFVFATGDTALSINDWSYDGVAKDGRTARMSGTTSDVLVRSEDGVWRYKIDNPYGTRLLLQSLVHGQ